MKRILGIVLLVGFVMACSDESESRWAGVASAENFDGEECAACAMIVREQPSPRGQVVHADGERAYFCAISDLLTYLDVPSPHGEAAGIFVEVNDSEVEDPLALDTRTRPWLPASDVVYVVGFERERVMGRPVLVYRSRDEASRVAQHLGAEVKDWDALRSTN